MKKISFALLVLGVATIAVAQLKPLDLEALGKWSHPIEHAQLSNDGKFALYTLGQTLVVQAIEGSYKKEIKDASREAVTEDSRYALYALPGNKLGMLELATGKERIIS